MSCTCVTSDQSPKSGPDLLVQAVDVEGTGQPQRRSTSVSQ
jgi:hypothetical protein